ncbi:MAG: MBL fold metallo-hydrolase [Pseudoalteromonas sp.]|nr:MBL fold metallo-hydrolase [Pseudoalteromonas sp.]
MIYALKGKDNLTTNISSIKKLEKLLSDYIVWHDVLKRVVIFSVLATCLFLFLLVLDNKHQTASAPLSQDWSSKSFKAISIKNSTNTLSVTPVVNYYGERGFATESGVSYLIQTDEHTILFDLGHNHKELLVSPLEQNLERLGVAPKDLDAIFISHFHRDHIGGRVWEDKNSIGFGFNQPALENTSIFAPVPLTYPGVNINVIREPKPLFNALASTGPIPRQLVLGKIDEQALVINVKNKGLVVIVGCGHQTLNKLISHIDKYFDVPLYGLIGDVHLPLEQGRLHIAGIDIQRRLASGEGLFSPIDKQDVLNDINLMSRKLKMVALGTHDTSDKSLLLVEKEFTGELKSVRVGKKITIN